MSNPHAANETLALKSTTEELGNTSMPFLETITKQSNEIASQKITLSDTTQAYNTSLQAFIDFLQIGGPVVWLLVIFSIIATTIGLVKLWQFIHIKAEAKLDIEQSLTQWQQGKTDHAIASLIIKRPVSHIILTAEQGCLTISHAPINQQVALLENLKEELSRQANKLIQNLRLYLRPLEMIATLSPLLGLLGTVLGMIEAFQQMEAAGNQVEPSILSGGIWQALLTTAVGLAVAIPVVMLYGFFERKCERVANYINDAVTRVFTQMPATSLTYTLEAESRPPHAA